MKSPGKHGNLISKATGGPYSHAAIYDKGLHIFEAQGDGVGYTKLKLEKVEVHSGHPRQFCDVSQYDRIDVFRLPPKFLPADYGSEDFRRAFSEVLWHYNGLHYSKLPHLAEASSSGRATPRFAKAVMSALGALAAGDSGKTLPGPFCSELVVEVLNQSGFEILTNDRAAQTVSPSDLADARITRLVKLEGCFDAVSPDIPNDERWFKMLNVISFVDKETVRGPMVLDRRIDELQNKLQNLQKLSKLVE